MNAKIGIILGVVVIILLGIGGFLFLQGKNSTQENSNTMTPKTGETGTFESLQDIFSNKSLSLACDYTDPEGRKTVTYIKGGMVRTDIVSTNPQESGSIIVKENTMYFWNATSGITMKFNPEDMANTQNDNAQSAQGQKSLQDLEKYKKSCKTSVVNDSLFTPPSTVKFQDMSSMMKMIPSGGAAANGTENSAPTQEEIEALMKQYQQGNNQ